MSWFRRGPLSRCTRRLHRAERLISEFLDAYDSAEMSNVAEAVQRLRVFRSQV